MNEFFNDSPPYTYEFGMDKALEQGFLAEYMYFPVVVELNEVELEEYIAITRSACIDNINDPSFKS